MSFSLKYIKFSIKIIIYLSIEIIYFLEFKKYFENFGCIENMKFLFLLFGLLHHVNVLNASISDVNEEGPPVERPKSNIFLTSSKPLQLTINNNTVTPVRVVIENFYHLDFDEEDFSTGAETAVIFDSSYLLKAGRGRVIPAINGALQVFLKAYRERTEETAIILANYIDILPGASEIIKAIDTTYIGKLICETAGKHIVSSNGELTFFIEDSFKLLLSRATLENNQFEITMLNANQGPFVNYLFQKVFVDHRATLFPGIRCPKIMRQKFYQKVEDVYQAGLEIIGDQSEGSAVYSDFKIPLLTHTVVLREGEGPLFDTNQKRRFLKTIQTLSTASGWRHFVWVNEDSVADLDDILGSVEIKHINSSGFEHLSEINQLIQSGDTKGATAFLRYAALKKHGGVSGELSTEIIRNLSAFNAIFDFYAGIGTTDCQLIHSGIIAAKADHPIIERACELSAYHTIRNPDYLSNLRKSVKGTLSQSQDEVQYQIKYNKGVLNLAFYKCATSGKDMVFGPDVFSPKRSSLEIPSFDDPHHVLTSDIYAVDYTEGR